MLKDYFVAIYENKIQNVHQEHIADEVFNIGKPGIEKAINIFNQYLDNKADITMKWDGSPAIVFGKLPETINNIQAGTFFVSTKSFFNKTPKFVTKEEDLNQFNEGPRSALKDAFIYLKQLNPNGIYQCDLLFGGDKQKEIKNINNIEYLTFTPNTITYAIEKNSSLANEILLKKIGIVVHTKYIGKSIKELIPYFNISTKQENFLNTKDVWVIDAKTQYNSIILNEQQKKKLNEAINRLKSMNSKIDKSFFDDLNMLKPSYLIKTFINSQIREQNMVIGVVDNFLNNFKEWIFKNPRISDDDKRINMNIISKKDFESNFKRLLGAYKAIEAGKDIIVNGLNEYNKNSKIKAFIKQNNEYKLCGSEGYCSVDKNGNIVKLIDRLTFSAANFAKQG